VVCNRREGAPPTGIGVAVRQMDVLLQGWEHIRLRGGLSKVNVPGQLVVEGASYRVRCSLGCVGGPAMGRGVWLLAGLWPASPRGRASYRVRCSFGGCWRPGHGARRLAFGGPLARVAAGARLLQGSLQFRGLLEARPWGDAFGFWRAFGPRRRGGAPPTRFAAV